MDVAHFAAPFPLFNTRSLKKTGTVGASIFEVRAGPILAYR